jgi:hypothetical protein
MFIEAARRAFLLASQRAVYPALSTYGPKHLMIRPWHPYTKESQQAVTANEPTEYNLGQELGGTITLLHDSQHASNVVLPYAP